MVSGIVFSTQRAAMNRDEINKPSISSDQTIETHVLGSFTFEDPLGDWLVKLAKKEGCSPTGTWDVYSQSYGKYCFKIPYFKEQVEKFNLAPYAEDHELMNLIQDNKFQDKLVRLIFESDSKAWIKWGCSVRPELFPRCRRLGITNGIGLPPSN